MADILKPEQTLLTGSIPAIAGIEDPSQARMILYQAGRPVHAPMDNVGLATDTGMASAIEAAIDATATAETRNRIVNGAMQVSQENGNTAGTTAIYYAADQWSMSSSTTGTLTAQRVQVVTPNGSKDRFRTTVTVADTSIAAGEYATFVQNIEGIRSADFKWGSAGARQVILRFGWKSPAGTYSVGLVNFTGSRSYIANFTVSAGQANTDTEQTFVIPGDVTGTWATDTNRSFALLIPLTAGTSLQGVAGWQAGTVYVTASNTNGMATASAVFELFDVSLHLDPLATGVAPPWVMPDEAEELAACQRYYWRWMPPQFHFNGYGAAGSAIAWFFKFPVTMRPTPVMSSSFAGATFSNCTFPTGADLASTEGFRIYASATATGNVSCVPVAANHVTASARL